MVTTACFSLPANNNHFCRKIIAGSEQTNASFDIEMVLYRNDSLTTKIQKYEDVIVPDLIYAVVELEIDLSNDRFFLQVTLYDSDKSSLNLQLSFDPLKTGIGKII